ncbi:tigger transposable element-derived protein 2-like [Daktulosphaira vitifoliae]|uniref:tigger transposable element-derived protein 2-like n=1 Tax=Daktulosphaira vitifoliae TaxID=58002 RepID=UPI0021AA0608|nr:tigger transposable element-derived protein 2-like [Daktulosphaira vitifoliae]
MSSQVQKRKQKTLTIKEKYDILDRLNRNESFSSLASEYGVGRSIIYDIKKNHDKIKNFVSTTDCGPDKRQTLKKAEHPEVKEALYMWFLQVYNADKSVLFWHVIPNKTFVSFNEKSVRGRKVSKERVTILPCANDAGTHALKMLVVGKSNKPRAFKNIDLPVHYYGQKSPWMTKDLFKKWFDECFIPEVKKWLKNHNFLKKALSINNAPGHPSEEELTTEDKCITVMFLPPNCTALIQPMDQHIIQFVNQDYKKNLLLKAVSKDQPIEKTLKEFNMKELKKLWPDIVNSPSNDPQISVTSEVIEKVAAETQIRSQDLEIWYHGLDKKENIFYHMSDDEIIKEISSNTTINQEDDDDVIATTPQVIA